MLRRHCSCSQSIRLYSPRVGPGHGAATKQAASFALRESVSRRGYRWRLFNLAFSRLQFSSTLSPACTSYELDTSLRFFKNSFLSGVSEENIVKCNRVRPFMFFG